MLFSLILALPFLSLTLGAPAPAPLFGIHLGSGPSANAKTTAVAAKTVDSQLVRPALFSRLAYCSAAKTKALTCGAPCDAVKGISVVASGGDDGKVPGCKIMFCFPSMISSNFWWNRLHRHRPFNAECCDRSPGN